MSKRDGCKQACCRVPFEGVCAKKKNCGCHVEVIRNEGLRGWVPTMETLLAVELQNAGLNR